MKTILLQSLKFFIVGFCGMLVNFFVSIFFFGIFRGEYFYSTASGIAVSIFSNFILNKVWTFRDRDFSSNHLLRQIISFIAISSIGITTQFFLIYFLIGMGFSYPTSLIFSILAAALGNFILNKKITFEQNR